MYKNIYTVCTSGHVYFQNNCFITEKHFLFPIQQTKHVAG